MRERELHASLRLGLAGPSEHVQHVSAVGAGEVQVLDLVVAVDRVGKREALAGTEVNLFGLADAVHGCREHEVQPHQVRRHAELLQRFAVVVQREVADLARGLGALDVG